MTKLNEKEVLARSHATSLSNVRKLICWGSDLTDITIVRQMVNLEILNVSVNKLTTLSDLSRCPRLKELYIRKNHVNNIDEIAFLKNLPQLTVLWINDNPISKIPRYRETVIRNIPSLVKLDSIQIGEEERDLAAQHGQLIASDEILPDYEGLDLNHTLTINTVALHIKNNLRNQSHKIDEKLPIIELDSKRSELNVKNSMNFESDDSKSNGDLKVSKSLKGETRTSFTSSTFDCIRHSNTVNSRQSNTVAAIKLLLKDLEHADLQEVCAYAQTLLKCDERNICNSRSAGILED